MRLIVLAAGEGLGLDGFQKLLIRHPRTGECVMDQYLRLFAEMRLTVVVGYRAVELMHLYPQVEYVYNRDWRMTNNAYSLALALDREPCIVLSSDLFLDEQVVAKLREAGPDCVLTERRENRTMSSIHCSVSAEGWIGRMYQGALESEKDPEAIGVFSVSTPGLLEAWRQRCLEHGNVFAGMNLPVGEFELRAVDSAPHRVDEINTPDDYLRLVRASREGKTGP
ncbi:MAG: NTP transferase domain-containing protein [Deltaproteobacteria bacterium]|nr:NTP transferase domain-containing protein [Deltaproteobacteria bacterium]